MFGALHCIRAVALIQTEPPAKFFHFGSRKAHSLQDMFFETCGGSRRYRACDVQNYLSILADFALGVLIEAEHKEAEEVMQVDLPVPFGIERKRQCDARDFPGETKVEKALVLLVGELAAFFQNCTDSFGGCRVEWNVCTALFVVFALRRERLGLWDEKFIFHDGVAA